MARLTRWRRAATTALALTTLFALPVGTARAARPLDPAAASRTSAQGSSARRIPPWVCDYRWRDGKRQVKRLIRPKAYNPGGYAGVFQQATRFWSGRAKDYGFPNWSAFNGRANVIVSIRMAHTEGWGAWGCA